jgi:alkanesulfonate monooxygenase SsuD/methylene tetrahydromethanopterin reductase-like flavin-dependent oxidoreductase (luciferase family)
MMKFGLLYNTDYYPDAHGSASKYYNEILEQTEFAEELGYHAVWFGEHHYSGYSFGSPPVIAMAAASRTKRIKLGTGVSLIPLNHPIRLAEEYAMLDVLSGGRLEYGIGRGFLNYSYQIFGVNPEESHERYREGTELITKAWTANGPFSFDGKFWKLTDYAFFPKPLQQPHPPIFASGAITPESFVWAGSKGFHLSSGFFLPAPDRIRENIGLYRQALRESGFDPAMREISGVYQMYCGDSREEAREHGGVYALQYYKFFDSLDRKSPHTSAAFKLYQRGVGSAFAGRSYEDLEKMHVLLIGDPDTLISQVRWAQEFYGATYLILEVAQGGEPHQYVMRSLERFAKPVMPAFLDESKTTAPK